MTQQINAQLLAEPDDEHGSQVQFYYVAPRGVQVAEIIAQSEITEGYNDDVQTTPVIINR